MKNKKNSQTEALYLQQIEKYEANPIVRNVIAQTSTFKGEVEGFYNLSTWWDIVYRYPSRSFKLGEEDITKHGRIPEDLIKILNPFSKGHVDANKSEYESVREDYGRWNSRSFKLKGALGRIGLCFGGLAGIIYGGIRMGLSESGSLTNADVRITIPALVVGAVCFVSAYRYYPNPKGTNFALEEYEKLIDGASAADDFMTRTYRNHFIKKALLTR